MQQRWFKANGPMRETICAETTRITSIRACSRCRRSTGRISRRLWKVGKAYTIPLYLSPNAGPDPLARASAIPHIATIWSRLRQLTR
jgi:hypothetical protein